MVLPLQTHLYVYSKFQKRLTPDPKTLPFYFFGSSSAGNSVYLKSLRTIIDLGFPYKRYIATDREFFTNVDYIILTHQHGDHLNPATLMHILRSHPNVTFLITRQMAHGLQQPEMRKRFSQKNLDDLLAHYTSRFRTANVPQLLKTRTGINFLFTPHLTEHGQLTNVAVELTCNQLNLHFMYASDLDTLGPGKKADVPGLPQSPDTQFNLLFLEANYDKEQIDAILSRDPHNFRARSNLRHISEQAAWPYVTKHLTSDGWFVPLHASPTFGTLVQDLT